MGRIEKTVFISYRRTDESWGLAIFQDLTQHGYDVFIDYDGIASGNFGAAILENIKARAHFLVLLTPTALERCGDPNDWMRREIEAALDSQRNIVPVMLTGFKFGTSASQLTGKLAPLKQYNGLPIPAGFFSEAMVRLRNKFLNVPVDAVLHPASASAQQVAKELKDKATMAAEAQHRAEEHRGQKEADAKQREHEEERRKEADAEERGRARVKMQLRTNARTSLAKIISWVQRNRLIASAFALLFILSPFLVAYYNSKVATYNSYVAAQAYGSRGDDYFKTGDFDRAIAEYSEAIRLNPNDNTLSEKLGHAYFRKKWYNQAIVEYAEAIQLNPKEPQLRYYRGKAYDQTGDYDKAIANFTEAIRLTKRSDYRASYLHARGQSYYKKMDYDRAIANYERALEQGPYSYVYKSRADAYLEKKDYKRAIADYTLAIQDEKDSTTLTKRGRAYYFNDDYGKAIADYDEAIRLDPTSAEAFKYRELAKQKSIPPPQTISGVHPPAPSAAGNAGPSTGPGKRLLP